MRKGADYHVLCMLYIAAVTFVSVFKSLKNIRHCLLNDMASQSLILLSLVPFCLAGLQVPLTIINLSPFPAVIDMNGDSNCIKGSFNPSDLNSYYSSWPSSNLVNDYDDGKISSDMDNFLQTYKQIFGINDLGSRRYSMYSGVTTLPAAAVNQTTPFGVFETEMAGSGTCFGSKSWKKFTITAGPTTTFLQIYDPPTSNWQIIKDPDGPNPLAVDIGPGGKANVVRVVIDAVFGAATIALTFFGLTELGVAARAGALALSAATPAFYTSTVLVPGIINALIVGGVTVVVGGGGMTPFALNVSRATFGLILFLGFAAVALVPGQDQVSGAPKTVTPKSLGFYDVYSGIDLSDRSCCLMGDNIMGEFDCLVASTSIVIQADGTTFAIPMPQISRAWT